MVQAGGLRQRGAVRRSSPARSTHAVASPVWSPRRAREPRRLPPPPPSPRPSAAMLRTILRKKFRQGVFVTVVPETLGRNAEM